MNRLLVLIFGILFVLNGNAQVICDSSYFAFQKKHTADSLIFSQVKDLPDNFYPAFKVAASYFPELEKCNVIFKERRIYTTLNVRPSLGSLIFCSKNNRKYIVRINNYKRDSVFLLSEVPYYAQIGLFGHELSHIKDYKLRSNINVIFLGASFINKKKREKYEKAIDKLTIQQGLGCYLLEWASFIQYKSDAKAEYKKFKRDLYLEPDEILELITIFSQ